MGGLRSRMAKICWSKFETPVSRLYASKLYYYTILTRIANEILKIQVQEFFSLCVLFTKCDCTMFSPQKKTKLAHLNVGYLTLNLTI